MDAYAFRISSFKQFPSITHQTHKPYSLFRSFRHNPFKVDSKRNQVSFDEAAFEAERLRLDAKARESMAMEAAEAERQGNDDDDDVPKAWKWVIRKRVWDLMEAQNIAQFPRPVHHRIPNFVGASAAANKGFAELEYGMLRYMGAIDDSTPIVTSVHDEQLVDDIPTEKLLIHDVPVDIVCTPTRVIFTSTSIPKPQGIYWEKLSPQKLAQIKILRELKARIERETGQMLPSGPPEKLPPTAQRRRKR